MVKIPLEEKLAIMELTYAYAFCVDNKRIDGPDGVVALFTEDGVVDEIKSGQTRATGTAQLSQFYNNSLGQLSSTAHFVTNHVITEYTGDTAKGRAYIFGEARVASGGDARVFSYYSDEYVKIDGRWRF